MLAGEEAKELVGSDRQLSREVPRAVPTINECPEASPCFFVHHLCAVTVGKDLETPQCSNSLSSPSPAAIQSLGPLCIPARFSLRGRKIVVYLKTSPLSDFFDKEKKIIHIKADAFQMAGPNILKSSGVTCYLNLLKAAQLITSVRRFRLNCAPHPRSGRKSYLFLQRASKNVDFLFLQSPA